MEADELRNERLSMRREEFAARRAMLMERSTPELIELLASEQLQTRFLAEMCLRDRTST